MKAPAHVEGEGGGQAGIACSVGGSGGQISVSSGGAGPDEDAGGQVDFIASAATAFGGSVMGAAVISVSSTSGGSVSVDSMGGRVAAASTGVTSSTVSGSAGSSATAWSPGSPGLVGTVCAHSGVFLPLSPFAEASDFDQSGSPFSGSPWGGTVGVTGGVDSSDSASESTASTSLSSGGITGLVCAQTGVVSLVGTARTGSSVVSEVSAGGVESRDSAGSVSKSG